MLSRALSLAAVMLLMDSLGAERATAQENLDAGKSPSQIFAGTCNACHKAPRGLLRTVPPGSLSGFLRQHYTTGPAMAGVLASYLISNGATDPRLGAGHPREGAREAKQEGRPSGPPEQGEHFGRRQHPLSTSQDVKPEPKAGEGQMPAQGAAVERGPDGQKPSGKQRFSKRGKPGAEEPRAEEPASGDKPKEAAQEEAKEQARPEAVTPPEGASQSAKAEEPSESPAVPADPVGPATSASEGGPTGVVSSTSEPSVPAMSAAAVAGGLDVPSVPLPSQSAPATSTLPAAPALPAVPPAGPPAPPISQ